MVLLRKSVEHLKVKDIKGLMMCEYHQLESLDLLLNPGSDSFFPSPDDADHEHALAWLASLIIRFG